MASAGEFAAAVLRAAGWEVLFSGMLFSIVLGLAALLRNASPRLRHALWALVLLRLVLPLDLSTPFSLGRLAERARLAPALESAWLVGSPASEGDGQAALGGEAAGAAGSGSRRGTAGWQLPVLALWMVGVVLVSAALLRRRRSYRKVVGKARRVSDPAVLELLSRWKRELGVRRPVRLVTSNALRVPFTYGAVRPVIFLPHAVLASGDAGLVEAVLAHELAHVRRWDDLILKAELCVASLYFFNPVAWLSLRQMREARERICDELVLSSGRLSARTYAQSIVAVVKRCSPGGER